ncbi:MAG TPA: hypothetical protein VH088_14610 [Terriglobales bacterium]|nr:hypothetical protein [Terriglobales bacterium]
MPTAWREALEAARRETDPMRFAKVVGAAEIAIFNRFQEMRRNPGDHQEERTEIRRAAAMLRELQVTKLNYPKM